MNRPHWSFITIILLTACGGEDGGNSAGASGTGPSGYACDVSTSGMDFSESGRVAGSTDAHNTIRSDHGLPDLTWDDSLAAYAYVWATELVEKNGCTMEHRPQDGSSPCNQVHGENLAWNSGYAETPKGVADRWASEVTYYDYESNSCTAGEMCGHYTQVVWSDTTHVGCAYRTCDDLGSQVWVCNYFPAGNYVGERPY